MILIADCSDIVFPFAQNRRPAVGSINAKPAPDQSGVSIGLIGAAQGAAITRGQVLDRLKGESSKPRDGADRATLVHRAQGMSRVLDHSEVIMSRQCVDVVEIAWVAAPVYWHDGLGARGD